MNATWLAILSGFGVLLWLATDQFVLFIIGALLGLTVSLSVGAKDRIDSLDRPT